MNTERTSDENIYKRIAKTQNQMENLYSRQKKTRKIEQTH